MQLCSCPLCPVTLLWRALMHIEAQLVMCQLHIIAVVTGRHSQAVSRLSTTTVKSLHSASQSGGWGLLFSTIDSLLPLILEFSTDLKRIQNPHSLFKDFWAYKTCSPCWSGCTGQEQPVGQAALQCSCRAQVWVIVQAPIYHVAITP